MHHHVYYSLLREWIRRTDVEKVEYYSTQINSRDALRI